MMHVSCTEMTNNFFYLTTRLVYNFQYNAYGPPPNIYFSHPTATVEKERVAGYSQTELAAVNKEKGRPPATLSP